MQTVGQLPKISNVNNRTLILWFDFLLCQCQCMIWDNVYLANKTNILIQFQHVGKVRTKYIEFFISIICTVPLLFISGKNVHQLHGVRLDIKRKQTMYIGK